MNDFDRDQDAKLQSAVGPKQPSLLLVEDERSTSLHLQAALQASGFSVVTARSLAQAEQAVADQPFIYAVVDLRLGDGNGLDLVRQLRDQRPPPRVVVITGYDSLAGTIVALRAGAAHYLPKPIKPAALLAALREDARDPAVPTLPPSAERVRWEHVHRIYEQCGRNISHTAQHLGMHRRTLQRMLAKRAPRERHRETAPEKG